jgi:hypothetical protein
VSNTYNAAIVSRSKPSPDASLAPESRKADELSSAEAKLASLVHDYGRLIAHAIRRVIGSAGLPDASDIEQRVHIALWQQLRREQAIELPRLLCVQGGRPAKRFARCVDTVRERKSHLSRRRSKLRDRRRAPID